MNNLPEGFERDALPAALTEPHLRLHVEPQDDSLESDEECASPSRTVIAASDIYKSYHKGNLSVPVLRGASVDVSEGQFLAIVGQSGSGKSTLLHVLGTLDDPDTGQIRFLDHRIDDRPAALRERLRNEEIGMIFQFYHLLPELSARENVMLPLMVSNGLLKFWFHRQAFQKRANELLEIVGLSHRANHKPAELSGGEMQRAAIARALIAKPRLLLADEPTGNLDCGTGQEIVDLLKRLNQEEQLTIVMVTHDQSVAKQAHRVVQLVEGRVAETE